VEDVEYIAHEGEVLAADPAVVRARPELFGADSAVEEAPPTKKRTTKKSRSAQGPYFSQRHGAARANAAVLRCVPPYEYAYSYRSLWPSRSPDPFS
jgi:hypothetical protein